jgi:hypothetical protein
MIEIQIETPIGLCYRCDYRAVYLETKQGPRSECKDKGAVCSCYMYMPVKPVELRPNENDNRPMFSGAILSARAKGVRIAEVELKLKKYKRESVIYWVPKKKRIKEDGIDGLQS